MSSSANLERRLSRLEANVHSSPYGAVILHSTRLQTETEAIADYVAKYGPIEGEPFFVRLVGVKAS